MKSIIKTSLISLSLLLTVPAFAANPIVDVQTSMGDFKVELYPEKAPITVGNFLKYVKDGSYKGTQFHRVIPGFVVQGGGFDEKFTPRPSTFGEIVNESQNGLPNDEATLSMARTSNPDSATRQFYINLANNSSLNATPSQPGYAVFGKVIEGFKVVQEIAKVKTVTIPTTQMTDVPQHPILIKQIALVQEKETK